MNKISVLKAVITILVIAILPLISRGREQTILKKNVGPEQYSIKVVYGDRTTQFNLSALADKRTVEFNNGLGKVSSRQISKSDWDFVTKEVQSLKGQSNEFRFCPRRYVSIESKFGTTLGCLGTGNRVATKAQNLANSLVVWF